MGNYPGLSRGPKAITRDREFLFLQIAPWYCSLSRKEEVKTSSQDICAKALGSVSSLLNPRLFHEDRIELISNWHKATALQANCKEILAYAFSYLNSLNPKLEEKNIFVSNFIAL